MIAGKSETGQQDLRFLIVDDHPLFREALNLAVKVAYSDAEIIECANLDEAQNALETCGSFDLALLDLRIPGASGFDGIIKLRSLYPKLPIVIVSGLEDLAIVRKAMSYGIAGFIPKSTKKDELTVAITLVMEGHTFLPHQFGSVPSLDKGDEGAPSEDPVVQFTPQQLRVITMIRDGLLNKQIAYELGVSETTVKAHVSKILKKLGVSNRTQAAMEIEKLNSSELVKSHDQLGKK